MLDGLPVFHSHLVQTAHQKLVFFPTGLVILQKDLLQLLVLDLQAVSSFGFSLVSIQITLQSANLFCALFEIGQQSLVVFLQVDHIVVVDFGAEL